MYLVYCVRSYDQFKYIFIYACVWIPLLKNLNILIVFVLYLYLIRLCAFLYCCIQVRISSYRTTHQPSWNGWKRINDQREHWCKSVFDTIVCHPSLPMLFRDKPEWNWSPKQGQLECYLKICSIVYNVYLLSAMFMHNCIYLIYMIQEI